MPATSNRPSVSFEVLLNAFPTKRKNQEKVEIYANVLDESDHNALYYLLTELMK